MKKFPIVTTNYETSLFPIILLAEVLYKDFPNMKIMRGYQWFDFSVGIWHERTNKWAMDRSPSSVLAKALIKRFENNKNLLEVTRKNIFKLSQELLDFSQKFKKDNLKNKTDFQLWQYYQGYLKKYKNMYLWGWVPNALEGEENIFTSRLEEYLLNQLRRVDKQNQIGQYFMTLTSLFQQKSERVKEKEDLLNILIKIKRNRKLYDLFKKDLKIILGRLPSVSYQTEDLLKNHTKKYAWLSFNYEGPALDQKYFVKNLKNLLRKDPIKELDKIKKDKDLISRKQKEYFQELGIDQDQKWSFLFELARWMFFLKDWRKNVLYQSYYHLDFLLREISDRLCLTSTEVRHLLPPEMKKAMIEKKYSPALLKERIKFSVALFKNKNYYVYTGEKAKRIVQKYVESVSSFKLQSQLTGQVAYPGQVRSRVKIISEPKDIHKMKKGEILVSEKTDPSLMAAIHKAMAIITDEGGITCHAAIVSRELKIPCIVGTKIATDVLKDGDLVEVDANKGIIKVLKKHEGK